MKNKFFLVVLLLLLSFSLVACGQVEEDPGKTDVPIGGDPTPTPTPTPGPIVEPSDEEVEFSVSLVYNKRIFIPEETITVYWTDSYAKYSQEINEEGYAKKKLDGDFSVYLDKAPEGYTYNPNIYYADNENPIIEIELLKIGKISKGKGTALYKEYQITSTGTYRCEVTNKTKKIYYEFAPKTAGYYIIESIVNVYDDLINPKLDKYNGTAQAKFFSSTLDDGGKALKGGYTKNFKWVVQLTEAMISNVYTFAIHCEVKNNVFPANVDFTITYAGEYIVDPTVAKLMVAEEANFVTPNFTGKYINADGGTGNYTNASKPAKNRILNGDNFKYNEETGYYHKYDKKTDTYGPILCAAITTPCAFYDEALSRIEYAGNKDLTLSNGTENYKQFIEVSYAACCNSDGVCYVTKELKEFLQKFAMSQPLFIDDKGMCEELGTSATQEDQWLFACGYYE